MAQQSPYDIRFAGVDNPLQGVNAHLRLPSETLGQGEKKTLSFQIFMGPKNNNMLRKMGETWGNIMNYGWFSPISRFLKIPHLCRRLKRPCASLR